MKALARTRTEIEAAWRSFVADGHLPGEVRPEIARSWRRVRARGSVDPALRVCPATPLEEALAPEDADEPARIAAPILARFADRLAADGHVVAYFDASGVMLTVGGNGRTIRQLEDVNFAPGACWAEDSAGTNGIGTALVEQRPVEVFASEHFVEAWQRWTCASVPVRCAGRVVGIVDITSPWEARHPGLLLTAEALAHAIEGRLEALAGRRQSEALLELAAGAAHAREAFLSVAAHELKTPLTPLQLELQRLQRLCSRRGPPLDPAALAQGLLGAGGHVKRLVDVIDDLLEASRVASQPVGLARAHAELGAIARDVVERLAPQLARHGSHVALNVVREAAGRWDRARLEQALKHLLVNAMKYAPGSIEVEIDAGPSTARVRVRDHGPGVAPEVRERIFAPFERGVSYRNVAGFGLGLHVVRRIVEAHGGAVSVDDAVGEGATFVLELPLAEACPPAR